MKFRIIFIVLLLGVVVLVASGCSVQKVYPDSPSGMRPINDGSVGAVLFVPEFWIVDSSTDIPYGYYSSTDRSMISLATVDAATLAGRDINDYWQTYRQSFENVMREFELIKGEGAEKDYLTRLIDGQPSYIYEFKAKVAEDVVYHYRQTLLKNPKSGDLYIITFSAVESRYETHLQTLSDVYDNFKFVDAPIEMIDDTTPLDPDPTVEAPQGMKLISNSFVNYHFFVPQSWIVSMNSGMSSAHVSESDFTSASILILATDKNSEEYWEVTKQMLFDTYGENNCTFGEVSDTTLDDYSSAKQYEYAIKTDSSTRAYTQIILINGGYAHILTFCYNPSEKALYADVFAQIADALALNVK